MNELTRIGTKYGTNKVDYHYLDLYEPYLSPIKESARNILEIGVHLGQSHRTWKEFFPNATIWGIDIDPAAYFSEDRIKILTASQDNSEKILEFIGNTKFDMILDDGSHLNELTVKSFNILFPSVINKGFYIIEDVQLTWVHSIDPVIPGTWPGMQYNTIPKPYKNDRTVIDDLLKKLLLSINNSSLEYLHCYVGSYIIKK
jgi:hypothetical protein